MPPPYAEPGRFSEHEVTVGTGPLAVSGTLSVPRGQAPGPGVVLLAGGGPFDRDETSGPNKPLKDLAWGLASRGTTVLRFDKATYAHRDVAAASDLTMTQEYVPHAVDAVGLLGRHRSVDPKRVFVLGHSMGGKVAPAVAVAAPTVAGLVIMAGDTQPMHHAAVRVVSYLATVLPDQVPPAVIETFQRQAALVDSAELTPSTPAADLPFGLSAPYWLELRDYDPVAIAAGLSKPMLILKEDATTRSPSLTTSCDGGRAWPAGRKPISESTKPTTTCSSPAQDHPPPPNMELRSMSTPPSSPTSPTG
ncbi:alpha/beta hydrolase family protein [Streptomyces aureus]